MLLLLLALLAAGGPPKWVKEVTAPPGTTLGQGIALPQALAAAVFSTLVTEDGSEVLGDRTSSHGAVGEILAATVVDSPEEGPVALAVIVRARGVDVELGVTNDVEWSEVKTRLAARATGLADALHAAGFQWEKYTSPKDESVWVLLKPPKGIQVTRTDASRALLAGLAARPAEGTPAWIGEKRPAAQGGKNFSGLGQGATLAEAVADALGQVAEELRGYADRLTADYMDKTSAQAAPAKAAPAAAPPDAEVAIGEALALRHADTVSLRLGKEGKAFYELARSGGETRTRTRDAQALPRYLEELAKKARVETHCASTGARLCHALVVWSL